jgi:putative ABC transport system permease protein
MNFLEGVSIALWSLRANPLRSFLTLLGIIIGVTAIIAVVAVINGLNLYVEEKIITLGPAAFEVNRYGIITNREQFLRAIRRNRVLRLADAEAVKSRSPMARMVGVKVYGEAEVKYLGRSARSVSLKGITPPIMLVEPYEIQQGRAIIDDDNNRAASVAFLGAELSDELFGNVDPIGKEVKVNGRSFEVVGVGARRGSVFGHSRDSYLLMPLASFYKIFGSHESIAMVVRVSGPDEVEQAMDETRVVLRSRHHLRYDEPDDFGLVTSEGLNALWSSMTRTIFQVALFVVGISLVVGGIVIMNIMLVSVIERTREIGVRKAVGARHRDIRTQFLIESAALAAAGGLMGVVLAWTITQAIAAFSPLPAVFPWWAPLLAVSLSSAVGVFFGLYPSAKAARLNPIDALRSE